MIYTIDHFQQITEGCILIQQPGDTAFKWLATDTRQVINGPASLFVALKGPFHNAHHHLSEAISKGIRNFVVSEKPGEELIDKANWLIVRDTLVALQKIARYHRDQFSYPVIGITGSNGKTWVKEWLCHLLNDDFNIVKSPKSFNSQVGVPLSVWSMKGENDLGIFEAGISMPGEMKNLTDIIQPDIGVFTYLGDAHSVNFTDLHSKLAEKWKLFDSAKTVIACPDQPEIARMIDDCKEYKKSFFMWSVEDDPKANVHMTYEKAENGTLIRYTQNSADPSGIFIPFDDEASLWNASTCLTTLLAMGLDPRDLESRFATLEPIGMRMELVEGISGSLLINDSYNSDMEGLKKALSFMQLHSGNRKRYLVISDLTESGTDPGDRFQMIASLLDLFKIDKCFAVGEEIAGLEPTISGNTEIIYSADSRDLEYHLKATNLHETIILFKAARKFRLDRVCESLELVTHLTELEIHLDALRHNLEIFRKKLSKDTQLIAVIKAAAYGIGSQEIARFLERVNIDRLAVAYTDEGVELRNLGVDSPILVLNPDPSTFELMLIEGLEPEIYSLTRLQQWISAQDNSPYQSAIHLKLETGMHRLGIEEEQIEELCDMLSRRPDIQVASVMTHLAASEDPDQDVFSKHQTDLFLFMYQKLADALGYFPFRHVLNSNGILRFPQYHFEAVRLGIGLYGVGIRENSELRPVHRLVSRIAQIKEVEPGESVGYNRSFIAEGQVRVATINLGYADGLPRNAGNGRFSVYLRGYKCPILGNVCMDMTMIDVTQVPGVREGEEVVIFGPEYPMENLSNAAGTIPYEILTGIGPRVKRRFIEE